MKKFLALFLIAIVACEAVEEFDLENWISDAWNWLKEKGILDAVKNIAVTAGKAAAIAYCSPYLSPPVCTIAVNAVCSALGI